MRPCKACSAAMQNNETVCPECGAEMPLRTYEGPPPQTGPGISGGPEEREQLIGMIAAPLIVGLIATVVGVSAWGPWGILAGVLMAGAVFVITTGLDLL